MSAAASSKIHSQNIIDYRHIPNGEPQYGYTNDSFNGDTLQVRMSALPQDSGSSAAGKSDALFRIQVCLLVKVIGYTGCQ